ncbi:molybdopterin-dependent oxidoreductase, partial [Streptomyces capoamus]
AVKDWAIRHFGTNDKLVLQLGILAVLAVLALVLGALAVRFRRVGAAGVLLFGIVGAAAAVSRPDSTSFTDALPSVVGAVAGALLLYVLVGRLTAPARPKAAESSAESEELADPSSAGWDRRGFVLAAASAAAASAAVGAVGRSLNASHGKDAVASRNNVVLPSPGSPAQPVPKRAGLRVPGISPFVTPNDDFYRVDTALVVPKVDATAWRLRIHGKGVRRPATYSFDDLLRRELIERDITLTCVSNEV